MKQIKNPKDIGVLVKDVRKNKKISQEDIAQLAGVGRRFVSELENGKSTLEIGKVLQVLKRLGIDLTAHLRGSDE